MARSSLFLVVALLLPIGCGDDDDGGDENVVNLTAGPNVQTDVQTALLNAVDGQTLVFAAGTYNFTEELSLVGKKKIRIKGGGATRDEVIWNFSGLGTGSPNGLKADQVEDLIIENLTVKDSPGDGIRVEHGKNVTFRNLHIFWSGGSLMTNGAYALYPVLTQNILVENCLVEGASDAGIYVGQSKTAMVRNNTVKGNVTGIEIENTDDAEVVGNTAMDNTSGILVFNLPNLPNKTGSRTNNHAEFAHGGIVAFVPPGTGMILLANDDAEVHNNMITGHKSTGIVVVSCQTVELLTDGQLSCSDSGYDNFAEGSNIHDNTFSGNGTDPQGFFAVFPTRPLYDIIWDGVVNAGKPANGGLCIKANGTATFAKLSAANPTMVGSTDMSPHDCTKAALAGVTVTWGQ